MYARNRTKHFVDIVFFIVYKSIKLKLIIIMITNTHVQGPPISDVLHINLFDVIHKFYYCILVHTEQHALPGENSLILRVTL